MEISGWIHVSSYRFGTGMNKLILSILVCFILTIPTRSYSFTGLEWLHACEGTLGDPGGRKGNKEVSEMMCKIYLKGLRDMEG